MLVALLVRLPMHDALLNTGAGGHVMWQPAPQPHMRPCGCNEQLTRHSVTVCVGAEVLSAAVESHGGRLSSQTACPRDKQKWGQRRVML